VPTLPPALQHVTPSTVVRQVIASLATLVVRGGIMGLATYGSFGNAHDTITRSTAVDAQ
jgi:hypothetical protein